MTDLPPSVLDHLPTPCLVVDSAAASRNIQHCAAFFSGRRTALRPHFKAHKCTTLMRQQLAAGRHTRASRRGSRAVLNAGLKELTVEYGMPAIQAAGARITALSDEHAQVRLAAGQGSLAVGDKVLLIPAHVDPAVNLYDRLFALNGSGVTEWEVDGRRRYRLTRE